MVYWRQRRIFTKCEMVNAPTFRPPASDSWPLAGALPYEWSGVLTRATPAGKLPRLFNSAILLD
jgi:hypothetical protein